MAMEDYKKGEYQWVAQITKELVYADPKNKAARLLCADALELRKGNQDVNAITAKGQANTFGAMTVEMLLDYIGILTDAALAEKKSLIFALELYPILALTAHVAVCLLSRSKPFL